MQVTEHTLWNILRIAVAILLAAHGWHRLLDGGVAPFGVWLNDQGLVIGPIIAWFITIFEITATVLLVLRSTVWRSLRKYMLPICLVFVCIYASGIVLVHAPYGWWVVGGGRNGMEYSVLLIVVLLCLGFKDAGRERAST